MADHDGLKVVRRLVGVTARGNIYGSLIEVTPGVWFQYNREKRRIYIGDLSVPMPVSNLRMTGRDRAIVDKAYLITTLAECERDIGSETLAWWNVHSDSVQGLKIGLHERHLIEAAKEWFLTHRKVEVSLVTF